jgi:ribosome-binding factor A
MPTRRQQRLNELLEQELMLLVLGRLDDPRLQGVAVTRVETTQDMSTAKVYVTRQPEDDADAAEMLEALQHAEPFIRSQLGNLKLRRLPHLVFARDRQYESGQRVLDILAGLEHDLEDDSGSDADGASETHEDDDSGEG